MKYLLAAIISAVVLIGGIYVGERMIPQQPVSFGAFTPVQASTFTLAGAGITNSQNTIQLASFTLPDPNKTPINMSMFGSIGYGVIEPQTSRIENVSFTGVTQNGNGSATLTGVVRGISFYAPFVSSTTLMLSHAGGANFILSNSASFYGQFAFPNNPQTWLATQTYGSTTPPVYDADPIWGNFSTQVFADVSYVNSVVAAGAANASETVKGIIQLATATQASLGTSLGSTGARLALGNNLATSTPGLATVTGDVPTLTGSTLNANFINQTATYLWSGLHTFSAGLLATASSTFNVGTLHIGNKVISQPNFGGTGVDGSLAISSGTTTVALGTANYYEKDYTSIAITGTGGLSFSSAATSTSGVTVVLKSQGVCTFTSSQQEMINLQWLGGGLGTGGIASGVSSSGSPGAGGGGGGSTSAPGTQGNPIVGTNQILSLQGVAGVQLPALASSTLLGLPGGNGGTGSSGSGVGGAGGAGGLGGGGLYIECAGAYNFTTGGFMAAGASGSVGGNSTQGGGGGGGGGGGNIFVRYGSLTADIGTYVTTGGGAGGGGSTGGATGGGGAAGSHLEVLNTSVY